LHRQKAYRDTRYREEDFSVTNALCASVISLPMHTELTDAHISRITDEIKEYLKA
jgi:UDP-2-acetamido-2-deoxy-ribo-hexuluronate aminotransferase